MSAIVESLSPHLLGSVVFGFRLLPVALFCPWLGGPLAPVMVRVALPFGLGGAVYYMSGAMPLQLQNGVQLIAVAARELFLGMALAFVANLPFEAVRAGGRLIDTVRGATLAELHVPLLRQRETALGDLLTHWALVLGVAAGSDRLVIRALLASYQAVPLERPDRFPLEWIFSSCLSATAEMLAIAFCLAAPAVVAVLSIEIGFAVALHALPQTDAGQTGLPARACAGLVALTVGLGFASGRLLGALSGSERLLLAVTGA